ncbi:hypothetical protein ABPG74_015763 [Tetrahymena malaccensis]
MQNSVQKIMKNLSDPDSTYLLSKVQKAEEKGFIKKPLLLLIQHFHKNYKAQTDHQEEDDDNLKLKNKINSKSFQKLIQKLDIKETAMSIDQYYSRYLSLIQNNQNYKSDFEQYLNETIRKKQKRIDEEVIGKNGNRQNQNYQNEIISNQDEEQKQQALQEYIQQQDINSLRDKEIIQKAIKNLNESQSIQRAHQSDQNDKKDPQIQISQDDQQKKQIQNMESHSQQTQENSQSMQNDTKNINQDYSQNQGGKQMIKGNNLPFKIKKQRDVLKKPNENQMISSQEQKEADLIHRDSETNNLQNYKNIDKNTLKGADKFKNDMQNNQIQMAMQNQNIFNQEHYQNYYNDTVDNQQYFQYQMGQSEYSYFLFYPESIPQELFQELKYCLLMQKKLFEDVINKNYENMDQKIQEFHSYKNQLDEKLKPFQKTQNYSEFDIQKIQRYNQEYCQQMSKEDTQNNQYKMAESKGSKEQKVPASNLGLDNSKQVNNSKQFLSALKQQSQALTTGQHQKNQKGNQSQKQKLSQLQNEGNNLEDNFQKQQIQKNNYSQNETIYSDSSNKEAKVFQSQKNENTAKEKASQKINGKNEISQQNKISNENFNQIKDNISKSFQNIDKQRQINNLGYQNQPNQMLYNKQHPLSYEQQKQYAHHYHPQYPNHHHPPPPPYTPYNEIYPYYQAPYQPPPNHTAQPPLNSQPQIKFQKQQPPPFIAPPQQQQLSLHETNYRNNVYPPQPGLPYIQQQQQYNDFQNNGVNLQNYNKQQQIQKQQFDQEFIVSNNNTQQKIQQNGQGSLSQKGIMPSKNLSELNKKVKNSQIEEIQISESSESDVQLIEDHQKMVQQINN